MSTPSSPPPAPQYEFTEEQNQIVRRLAGHMRWVAWPLLFIASLYTVVVVLAVLQFAQRPDRLLAIVHVALAAAFFAALAIWTNRSADAFQRVAQTEGEDVKHLMEALDYLRKTYGLLGLLVKIYILLVFVALLIGIIMLVATESTVEL